jgi:hypothetical protein
LLSAPTGARPELGRRSFLGLGAALTGNLAFGAKPGHAENGPASPPSDPPWSQSIGAGVVERPYGRPADAEAGIIRCNVPWRTAGTESSISFSPLQDLHGIMTPNGLFFERHHAGRPDVDPDQHRLMIHGLVARPLILTMKDIVRFSAGLAHLFHRACSMFSSGRSGFGRGWALVAGIMTVTAAAAGEPGHYGDGTTATPAQMARRDLDVRGGDGFGLPPGKGSVERGAVVRINAPVMELSAKAKAAIRSSPVAQLRSGTTAQSRLSGSYWPFAPTLFDYINRAMPFPTPHSLSSDDVYALTAYILNLNAVVPSDFVADHVSLPEVKMPNRENFTRTDPRPDTNAKPRMSACVNPADVRITSTTEGLTPHTTGPLDTMQSQ